MKACIFDLDGTLGDTLESLVYSVGKTLEEMGLSQITDDQCRSFIGNGARYLIQHSIEAAGDVGASRLEEGMEVYSRIFDENCTYNAEPYEGIPELLNVLKEKGIKMAVLSNKPHKQTVKVVHAMCGNELFDYIQGQKEEFPRKPDPASVYYVVEQLGIPLEECLYIGDSEVDVLVGKNAGIKTIAVSWGFREKEELKAAGAEYIIDKAEELLQFI